MDAAVPVAESTDPHPHPPNLQENESFFLVWIFNSFSLLFAYYGWGLVLLICLYLFFKDKIHSKLAAWKQQREDAEYHKNPDKFMQTEGAIQEARMKLQQKYEILAKEHDAKLKEKEEKRRLENLERQEKQQRGESVKYRSAESASAQPTTPKKTKPALRPAFNPMMGDSGSGGSSGWRPARRGGAGGG